MKDKDLLNALGLNDRTITLGLDDEYLQITLEKKIDAYLKKLDEEKKKQEQIDFLKKGYDNFKEKEHLIKMIESTYVQKKIKNILINMGVSIDCPYCLDLSKQYGRPIQTYKKHNK